MVSLDSGSIIGWEALIRWDHPEKGMLLPKDFLPLSKEQGWIVLLDEWNLRSVCQQLKQWTDESLQTIPWVSVNLSLYSFNQLHLIDTIKEVLEETQVDPSLLRVEIPELGEIKEGSLAEETIFFMKGQDISVWLDDFGTGHSNLSKLAAWPVEGLKIDQHFIQRLEEKTYYHTVKSVIQLGETLGYEVVAEGIETENQRELLQSLGCGLGQGFHFSKPVPARSVRDITSPLVATD